MESRAALQLDRNDRHVRRSHVRMGGGASRHRVAHLLEEGLRLVDLPGEDEGRVYYFRRVSLSDMPANLSRTLWMERLEQALGTLAAQAVHGNDPRARSANAVYFYNQQDALEALLRHALRSEGDPEWFWSSVMGAAPDAGRAIQIPAILELLRQQSIPSGAIAAIIVSALGALDPVALLSTIPFFTIRDWLRELDGSTDISAPPLQLPGQLRTALQRAAHHFGWGDLRTVWLASLAALCLSPAASRAGTAVKRARSTLRHLETAQPAEPLRRDAALAPDEARPAIPHRPVIFDDDIAARPQVRSGEMTAEPAQPSQADQGSAEAEHVDTIAAPSLLGEATSAAGLYFLLNALRQLRLPAALESCPELAEAALATHILGQLAAHAGAARIDPILACLHPEQAEFLLSSRTLAALPSNPEAWPPGFPPARRETLVSGYVLRVWTLAVRRWCWRMGGITVRDIVNRNGRVWLTRTDLDVTLPLKEADIRIRRIGLDIDPGWVPWLGTFGRVVRFHYRDGAPGGWAC
jgi:hypothetical protein